MRNPQQPTNAKRTLSQMPNVLTCIGLDGGAAGNAATAGVPRTFPEEGGNSAAKTSIRPAAPPPATGERLAAQSRCRPAVPWSCPAPCYLRGRAVSSGLASRPRPLVLQARPSRPPAGWSGRSPIECRRRGPPSARGSAPSTGGKRSARERRPPTTRMIGVWACEASTCALRAPIALGCCSRLVPGRMPTKPGSTSPTSTWADRSRPCRSGAYPATGEAAADSRFPA